MKDLISKLLSRFSWEKGSLLMLDFDGTIAPFSNDRMAVRPYKGVEKRLNEIICKGGRIVLISGRIIEEVQQLIRLSHPLEIWGCHGAVRMMSDGEIRTNAINSNHEALLKSAFDLCRKLMETERMEFKGFSLAIHLWKKSDEQIESIEKALTENLEILPGWGDFLFHRFDRGIELRLKGVDKGSAVRTLISETPENAAMAYLGDDTTDEDAFIALQSMGITALVRRQWRPTEAELWLAPPEELLSFLDLWIENIKNP